MTSYDATSGRLRELPLEKGTSGGSGAGEGSANHDFPTCECPLRQPIKEFERQRGGWSSVLAVAGLP